MHKLSGGAGMLGATSLRRLAGQVEAACRAGERERVASLTTILSTMLRALRRAAAHVLADGVEEDAPTPSVSNEAVEAQVLAHFLGLLRQQSMSAVDRFNALSPQLRGRLGQPGFDTVRAHIDNLRFDDAARLLEAKRIAARDAWIGDDHRWRHCRCGGVPPFDPPGCRRR